MLKNKFIRRYAPITIVMIIFSAIVITSFYFVNQPVKKLPIYSPSMVNQELVDEEIQYIKKYHKIKDFSMINQNGDVITQNHFNNKIYVADFFFTTCPTICIDMGKNFQRIQESYKAEDRFNLVSHTVMPEIDTVEVMYEYGQRMGAIKGKWHLLTGDKRELYRMARREYFAVMEQGTSFDEHDFIHTENLILVDEKKRIRGFYDGTSDLDIDRLIGDIQILLDRK